MFVTVNNIFAESIECPLHIWQNFKLPVTLILLQFCYWLSMSYWSFFSALVKGRNIPSAWWAFLVLKEIVYCRVLVNKHSNAKFNIQVKKPYTPLFWKKRKRDEKVNRICQMALNIFKPFSYVVVMYVAA